MPNDTVPSDGTEQTESENQVVNLSGFSKALSKRTLERDQARQETESLRRQISALNAVIAPDTDDDSRPDPEQQIDEQDDESTGWASDELAEPAKPAIRHNNPARDWADDHRDQEKSQNDLLDDLAAFEGKSRHMGPWGA